MIKQKIENGVMIIKDDKAWGVDYEDGNITFYGWVPLTEGLLYEAEYCTKPTDATYKNSFYIEELNKGKVIPIVKHTQVLTREDKG